MPIELVGSLAALALIDSTSFGTLLIPILFLLAPGRIRAGRVLIFLFTVAVFYFGVGLALLAGADSLLSALDSNSDVLLYGQLALGVGMFAASFTIGRKKDGERRGAGRFSRWRDRAVAADGSRGIAPVIGLALGAAALEVATMLPYLGAIGLLSGAEISTPGRVVVLAGYCLVMILPALALLAGRLVAHRRVEPLLRWVSDWMARSSGETLAWIIGIAGFLIGRDAAFRLGLLNGLFDGLG